MHAATNPRRRRRRAMAPRDPRTGRFLTARQRAARRAVRNPRRRRSTPWMWGGRKSRQYRVSTKRGAFGKRALWRPRGLRKGYAMRAALIGSGRTSWRPVKSRRKGIAVRRQLRKGALRRYGARARYPKRQRRWNNRRTRAGRHLIAARTIRRGQRVDGMVRLNPKTGEIIMPSAIVANPRRRRRRRRHVTVAPRRRRRRPSRVRRRRSRARVTRNPGVGSLMSRAKAAFAPALAGAGGGVAAGFLDTVGPLAGKPVLAGVAKFATAILGAALLRSRPAAAAGFVGGTMGSFGYQLGVRAGGGLVAGTKGQALKGLADMASDDPQLEATIADATSVDDLVNAGDMADLVEQ